LIAIVLFLLGSLGDNLLTYKYIVLEHRFSEANPIAESRIFVQPLWMWFVYDFVDLVITLGLAFGYYRLMLWYSRKKPLWKRKKILKIASKYWIIVFVVAIIRVLPVIHNVLLLCFGIETPLPKPLYVLGCT